MFALDFLPEHLLRSVYGTEPFADFCQLRRIPFAQGQDRPLPADGLARWTAALGGLSPEERAGVELDLAKVNELSGTEASALLLRASEPGCLPPDDVPAGAPLALWFLLRRPDVFHDVLLRHGSRDGTCWRTARVRPGLAFPELDARARALEGELRSFFRQGDAGTPACAATSCRLGAAYCFTAAVAGRLQSLQTFADDGRLTIRQVRPALTVILAYSPASGTVLLASPLRSGDRAEDLLRRASLAALGDTPDPGEAPFDLEPLKGTFRPLPDADDMEAVRVKTLRLRYPARLGRRQLTLETLPSDGPSAIEEMLRAHAAAGALDELRVCYAELHLRLRVTGGSRDHVVRLWPDGSTLGPTPLGDRLRACFRRWGLSRDD